MTYSTPSQSNPNLSAHPRSKWISIAAIIGAVWYAFGLFQFWLAVSMDTGTAVTSGQITAQHGAAIASTPLIVWLAFALASGAGLAGALLLFARSAAARLAFTVSLLSALVYYVWVYAISGTAAARPFEEAIIAGVVLAVTAGFLFLSRRVAGNT